MVARPRRACVVSGTGSGWLTAPLYIITQLTAKCGDGLCADLYVAQDARINRNNEAIKQSLKEYDESLEAYIPVLMAQAKIYWDLDNYTMVEKIFRQ